MRKPDPDDQCTCGHPRYGHIALSQGCTFCEEKCTEFQLRLNYSIMVSTWLEFPTATRVDVSRDVYSDLLGLLMPHVTSDFMIFGKPVFIDDRLGIGELAFSNGADVPAKVVLA